MKVDDTKFTNCYVLTPEIFKDFRGDYIETFNEDEFNMNVRTLKFIQDDISISYKNVLRGFHGDSQTWKLIQCMYGRFQFVIIDNDVLSPTYNQMMSITLDDKQRQQVLVPPMFGNAHLCLSNMCIFHYKQTTYYVGASEQFTLPYHYFKGWAIDNPILSERDKLL